MIMNCVSYGKKKVNIMGASFYSHTQSPPALLIQTTISKLSTAIFDISGKYNTCSSEQDEFGNLDSSFSDDGTMLIDLDGGFDRAYRGFASEEGPIYILINGRESGNSTLQLSIAKII